MCRIKHKYKITNVNILFTICAKEHARTLVYRFPFIIQSRPRYKKVALLAFKGPG